jgi:DNA polymerase-1
VKVDEEEVVRAAASLREEISGLERNIIRATGSKFNPASTKEVSEVLFDRLKLPVQKRTAAGKPSCDKATLEKLSNVHPVIPLLQQYRAARKLLGYFDGDKSLTKVIDENGRIHSSFQIHGTVVGRLSSREPSLHTIPKGPIRHIICSRDGWKFVEADFKAAEVRAAAFLSQDQDLLRDVEQEDIHRAIAGKIFKKPPEEITPKERHIGKTGVFGTLYGGLIFLLDLGLTEKEAHGIRDAVRESYTTLTRWMDETIETAFTDKVVVNLFGRRRHFNLPDIQMVSHKRGKPMNISPYELAKIERQAIHFPCASVVSDMLNWSLIRIHKQLIAAGFKAKLIMTLHDALFLEIPEEELEPVTKLVADTMIQPYKGFQLPIDMKIGTKWGKAEEERTYS